MIRTNFVFFILRLDKLIDEEHKKTRSTKNYRLWILIVGINLLSANPPKMVKHTQTILQLFVGLGLEGLRSTLSNANLKFEGCSLQH